MNTEEINEILMEKETIYKNEHKNFMDNKARLSALKKELNECVICKELIVQLGMKAQTDLKNYLEDIVTTALQGVFGDEYKFIVEFTYNKRDQVETNFFIEKNGNRIIPKDDLTSGGSIDVISFALKVACLFLEEENVDLILLQDEPFKNVTPNFFPAVSQMVIDICRYFELQIIMILPETSGFLESADNLINME
jgi:hypothetical protein